MTKRDFFYRALESVIADEMTYSPERFKDCSKELQVKAERIYNRAKNERDTIYAIMNGRLDFNELEDE